MSSKTKRMAKEAIKVTKTEKEDKKEDKSNEIKILKRTIDNNTHEVLQDSKLKTITSWRKSKSKFLKSLVLNIMTFGILHIISLFYPKLYIKLYCNPWPPKECDYFLVENIYGNFTLCTKIFKKNKYKNNPNYNYDISNQSIISSSSIIKKKNDNYYIRHLTYSFMYKSMVYEYNEITNEITPVYLDLSKLTNKEIRNIFVDGLSSEKKVTILRDRYGKNEYEININLIYLYFLRVELPSLIIVLIIGAFELYLKDYISFAFKYAIVLGIFLFEYLIAKSITSNLQYKDKSIDGEFEDIKVRRKYLLNDNDNLFATIKNEELLPGDVIFLKSKEIAPCDCLILEGECIVNGGNATGSLELFKRKPINNNNKLFNYELNKINIILHGMEISKTFSKNNDGYISALCINTGPNTFKANQYSNILDLSERKKQYKEVYNFFGGRRKYMFIAILCNFLLSILFGFCYALLFEIDLDFSNIPHFIYSTLLRTLCKSFMPMYFITNSIILLLSLYRLKKNNILCFDKSRLLNTGYIDTIFFSKTGTLCYNSLEIISYHPAYIHKQGIINIKNYAQNKCKEIHYILENYYQEFYFKKQINNNNYYSNKQSLVDSNKSHANKTRNQFNEYTVLFLECLLSCNNLEKFGPDLFGNNIEITIFNDMKWDMKVVSIEEDKDIYNNNLKKTDSGMNKNKKHTNINKELNVVQNRRNDIFPKNYFKISESFLKTEKEKKIKFQENNISTLDSNYLTEKTKNNNDLLEGESNSSIFYNPILDDISKTNIDSYILRIYKRFIYDGNFSRGSIVYNFMKKELRFMIKAIPEYLLDKFDMNTLPDNIEDLISLYRKNGLIILFCATKVLNVEEYNDFNNIDYYMNDLTFCGFIALKNTIKNETRAAIEDLKQYDINLIITSGDNINNSLSVGFDSGIIENKNIFIFDKEEENNKISIRKIYNVKSEKENIEEKENISTSIDDLSKLTSKKSQTKLNLSHMKQSLQFATSFIRSSKTRKFVVKKNDSFLSTIKKDKDNKDSSTPQIPKLNQESHKYLRNKMYDNRNLFKSSKILLDNSNNLKSTDKEALNYKSILHQSNSDLTKTEEKKRKLKSRFSSVDPLNIVNEKVNITQNRRKYTKTNRDNQEGNMTKRNNNNIYETKKSLKNIYQRFYYYPGIFKDNEELNDNCIFCISGRLFHFLYNNIKKKEYKYLLDKIHKYCKIFFKMNSIEKSMSIDFYREYPDSCICKIGECQSDFDPIMASNAGINLREPKNLNTILCHFYTADKSIKCIKDLIVEGRTNYENIFLLRISSIFCTMIINSYILTCFLRKIDVIIGQLNVLEISFLILSVTAFAGKPDKNIESKPLMKNKKLFNIHYYVQIGGHLFSKLIFIYFTNNSYAFNRLIEETKRNKIFTTYYFILCIELILSTSFTINYISFYRKNLLSNTFFMIFTVLVVAYFISLVTLNSSNLRIDIFHLTYFEYFEYLIDSFDDRNRLKYFFFCFGDFLIGFIVSRIIYFIFNAISLSQISSGNDELNS
jgi:magnesium-transporting ATPase (P-type)